MNTIADYLTIQNIKDFTPDTSGAFPFGWIDRGKGATVFLNTGNPIQFISLLTFEPQKGPRGRHKHLEKEEFFFIISGRLKAQYWLDDEDQAEHHIHTPDTLLTLKPGLFHVFECIEEPALVLEFSPQPFNLQDHHYASSPVTS